MSNYGMILGEPAEVYHATDGVSSHRLGDFLFPQVPLYYYRRYITKEAPSPFSTAAQAFGEYFHTLALEGEDVAASRFAISPKFDKRTKEGKQGFADFEARNGGKKWIDQEDQDLSWKMVKAIRDKPAAKALFDHGKPEVVFRHKLASFPIQSRIDWYDERPDEWQRPLIVDVKTIDHLGEFPRQFDKYRYYFQAAFYQMVVMETMNLPGAHPRVVFCVVEKNEPYQCQLFQPDEITLDYGRREVMAALEKLKACYDTGVWPGSPDEITPVSLSDRKLGLTMHMQ